MIKILWYTKRQSFHRAESLPAMKEIVFELGDGAVGLFFNIIICEIIVFLYNFIIDDNKIKMCNNNKKRIKWYFLPHIISLSRIYGVLIIIMLLFVVFFIITIE